MNAMSTTLNDGEGHPMDRLRTTIVITGVVISAALLVPASAEPVSAYKLLNCKFTTSTLNWQDSTTTSGYSSVASSSVSAWYATKTPLVLTRVTTGANFRITNGNYGNTDFDGITYRTCSSDGYSVKAPISWWNTYHTDGYSVAKRQSVMVHEVGHALGLDEFSARSCVNVPIMQPDTETRYDACLLTTPRNDDVNGIHAMYG
jgi:hypothetical protein